MCIRDRVTDLEDGLAAAAAQAQRQRADVEALSRTLAEQRAQAELATSRIAELDGRLAAQGREHDGLVKRIAALQGELQAREARLHDAEAAARREREQATVETEQGPVPLRAAFDKVQADKTALESQLAQAREERAKLQRELAQARRQAEGNAAAERADNDLLRERIGEVAAEVARLTAQLEGPGSPINAIVADEVWVNGAAPAREGAPANTLADRIRALQARASDA